LSNGLAVDGTNATEATPLQAGDEMSADEPTCSGNHDEVVMLHY
jgi:hypothetical protein